MKGAIILDLLINIFYRWAKYPATLIRGYLGYSSGIQLVPGLGNFKCHRNGD